MKGPGQTPGPLHRDAAVSFRSPGPFIETPPSVSDPKAETAAEGVQIAASKTRSAIGIMLGKGTGDKSHLLLGGNAATRPGLAVQVAAQLLGQAEKSVAH